MVCVRHLTMVLPVIILRSRITDLQCFDTEIFYINIRNIQYLKFNNYFIFNEI